MSWEQEFPLMSNAVINPVCVIGQGWAGFFGHQTGLEASIGMSNQVCGFGKKGSSEARPNLLNPSLPVKLSSAIIQSFGLLPIDLVAIKHIIIAVFEVFSISPPPPPLGKIQSFCFLQQFYLVIINSYLKASHQTCLKINPNVYRRRKLRGQTITLWQRTRLGKHTLHTTSGIKGFILSSSNICFI